MKRVLTVNELAQVKAMYEGGLSQRGIAERLAAQGYTTPSGAKISQSNVSVFLRSNGKTTTSCKVTPPKRTKAEGADDVVTSALIAHVRGLTPRRKVELLSKLTR